MPCTCDRTSCPLQHEFVSRGGQVVAMTHEQFRAECRRMLAPIVARPVAPALSRALERGFARAYGLVPRK